ncbi:unnamed protein product [Urochloa humidicola]
MAKDQQLLGICSTPSQKKCWGRLPRSLCVEVWTVLEAMFSVRSCSWVMNLHLQLANLKKGSTSMTNYLDKMKTIGDEITMAGRVVDEDEMVRFIFNALDFDYNPIVFSILGRTKPIIMSDLYAQLLYYKSHLEMFGENNHDGEQYQSSAYAASRGRGGRGCNPRGCGQCGCSSGG